MQALFTLVRELATRTPLQTVSVAKSLVQLHGLAPLAARAGVAEFRPDLAQGALRWVEITRVLPALVTAITEAGIRVAPIKGVAFATRLYDAPSDRPMNDIDLLVHPRDELAARRVLVERGYHVVADPPLHHASTWVLGQTVIDLHRNIVGVGRSRIDLDSVWSRVGSGWPEGAARLEQHDELVFHLVHLSRNRLVAPLMNVVDASRLVEAAGGWDAALERARSWGIGRSVQLAARFCREILSDSPSQRPGGWLAPSADELAALYSPSYARKLVFDLASAGSVRQAVARLAGYSGRVGRLLERD